MVLINEGTGLTVEVGFTELVVRAWDYVEYTIWDFGTCPGFTGNPTRIEAWNRGNPCWKRGDSAKKPDIMLEHPCPCNEWAINSGLKWNIKTKLPPWRKS